MEILIPLISKVRNFGTKASWLIEIAKIIKKDKNIHLTMEGISALKGVGRKSANVIMRQTKQPDEGTIAEFHMIRAASRIVVIPETKDRNKVEKFLMKDLPKEIWGEVGMAISFLGTETCRPTNHKHVEFVVSEHCEYCIIYFWMCLSGRAIGATR